MTRRAWARLIGTLVLLATALAPAPVAAQTAPPPAISINPRYAAAGTSGTWTIQVSGSGFFPNSSSGVLGFAGSPVGSFTTNDSGAFGPVTIAPARRGPGAYQVTAFQPDPCGPRAVCGTKSAQATFRSLSLVGTDVATGRDCAPAGVDFTLQVAGQGWEPAGSNTVSAQLLRDGSAVASVIRRPVAPDGTWSGSMAVPAQPAGSTYELFASDVTMKASVRVPWTIPCPPGPATTTTTSTSTTIATTTTTAPSTVVATLLAHPALGPPGFVTSVRGTGFPPGPVALRWEGGVGTASAVAGPDGTFTAQFLVLPGDRPGPRSAVATSGLVSANAPFLVVQGTVKPSGRDVSQITRLRRLGNR